MRINLINIILLVFLFASCKPQQTDNEDVPSNILSEEQFIEILTDAYLGEGAAGINIKNVAGDYYDSVYVFNPIKDHNITKSQFDSAIVYYTARPKKLKIIYEKVLNKLSQIQAKGKLK